MLVPGQTERRSGAGRLGGLALCVLAGGLLAAPGPARAQSGSLDMDVNPAAPVAAPAPKPATGSLDMDVNPAAPVIAPATPAPAPAPQSGGLDMDVNPAAPIAPAVSAAQNGARPADVQAGITLPNVKPPTGTEAAPAPGAPAPAGPGLAATPAPEPVALDHPKVIDTSKLSAGDTSVALFGIVGLSGEPAEGLQGYLAQAGNHVTCLAQPTSDFVCLLPDGTDVAQAALINGAARTKADAPDAYREQEEAAQAARRGIWSSLPPPPVTVKHPAVADTATLVADGKSYRLDGLEGFGAPFAGQMQGYIAANGDLLTCNPQGDDGRYMCLMADGTDIAKVALVNGAARVSADAPDSYRVQQGDALDNKRGIWLNPPHDVLVALIATPTPACCALVAGDDGTDGIAYVGGVPTAVIDDETVVMVYGGDAGWGYYDHWHHWHDAPDRYRHHLDHYHPHGEGLRGYHDRAAAAHMAEARPGVGHPAPMGAVRPAGMAAAGHPVPMAAGRPGVMPAASHPGMSMGGGFVHPGPSAAGFHPAAPRAAAAPHPSGGGGGKHR